MNDETRIKALNYGYYYLGIRPRTIEEMRRYLKTKSAKFGFSDDLIDNVIDDLIGQKLLDDQEFVRWYIEGKYASGRKSPSILRAELARLGVKRDIVDFYFEDNEVDVGESASKALSSQWRRYATLEPRVRYERAATYLTRKGFSYDVVKKTIAEYEQRE